MTTIDAAHGRTPDTVDDWLAAMLRDAGRTARAELAAASWRRRCLDGERAWAARARQSRRIIGLLAGITLLLAVALTLVLVWLTLTGAGR